MARLLQMCKEGKLEQLRASYHRLLQQEQQREMQKRKKKKNYVMQQDQHYQEHEWEQPECQEQDQFGEQPPPQLLLHSPRLPGQRASGDHLNCMCVCLCLCALSFTPTSSATDLALSRPLLPATYITCAHFIVFPSPAYIRRAQALTAGCTTEQQRRGNRGNSFPNFTHETETAGATTNKAVATHATQTHSRAAGARTTEAADATQTCSRADATQANS